MFKVYRKLPKEYALTHTIDSKHVKELLFIYALTIITLLSLFIGFLFLRDSYYLYPHQIYYGLGLALLYFLVLQIMHLILFKFKNRVKIKLSPYGVSSLIGAAGIYYPKTHYLIIRIFPFILNSTIITPFMFTQDRYWFLILYILYAFHFIFNIGNLYVFIKVLLLPKDVLIEDLGKAIRFFTPKNNE